MSRIPTGDPTKYQWNYAGMIFCPGRYFYGTVMLPFVRMPGNNSNGGDVTGLLWRYENTPLEWVFTYRFRYYAGKNNCAWDDRDRKTWYAVKAQMDESEAIEKTRAVMSEISLLGMMLFRAVPLPADWFLIQGDAEKAFTRLEKNPPSWMHKRTITLNEKRQPTKITTHMSDLPSQ